ncbi:putative transcriptional regulator [Gottschalkia purinilytica]|uniref:Putative transcriptional regulator n=1 Tax=Gottschalkia purinilytica TaxID=1503 RepID=A0A0L0WEI2_GOTPU|nr:helix-turn-helix transcriptional regulator [Gottschalkia purinilytica]KNF09846.1 putative transcriptional regulator [Gottschalkia purinilytica]
MLGDKITQLRLERNLSMNMLAKKSGVSVSVLFYIESKNRDPRFSTICKLAKALKVSIDEFIEKNDI